MNKYCLVRTKQLTSIGSWSPGIQIGGKYMKEMSWKEGEKVLVKVCPTKIIIEKMGR